MISLERILQSLPGVRNLQNIVGILTLWCGVTTPSAWAEPVEDIAPQREVSGHWWADGSVTGSTERLPTGSMRPRAELGLQVHAQADGGIANSFLFNWINIDGGAQLGAGGQQPIASASLSAEARVLEFRFMSSQSGRIYELVPIDVFIEADAQAIPYLMSRREFWRRPYTRVAYGGSLSLGDITGKGWDFIQVGYRLGTLTQDNDLADLRHRRVGFHATFVMYDHQHASVYAPDLHLDIVSFGANGVVVLGGSDAVVAHVDLARATGIQLWRDRLYADLSFGYAGTGRMSISGSSGDDTWSTTIDTENLPNEGSWTGIARLYGMYGDISAGIDAEKAAYLTVDVELAIESRIAAFAQWRNRHGELTVQAFASKNKLWLDKQTAEDTVTGGVSAAWRHPIRDDVSVITSVALANSFYASLTDDDGLRPESALGANAFVTVAKHFGSHWRDRAFMGF